MPDPERPFMMTEEPPAPAAPPAPSFGQVAQSGVLPEIRRSQEQYESAQKERAKRVGTRIEEEKQVIASQPREAPPEAQTPGPPPSRGLTPFLAPVEGERPESTIAKLIQGVGLLATGVAGRKDARGALSALTGALRGWQEGDKERADRHFADWQAQSDAMLKSWQTKRARWQDLQEDKKLTAQQRARLFELDLLKEGFPVDAAKANLEGWQYLQGIADKQQAHLDALMLARDKLFDAKERADADRDIKERGIKLKEDEAKLFMGLFGGGGGGGMSQVIDNLGTQYANGAQLSELTRGYGKYASAVMFAAQKDGIAKHVAAGRTPEALMLARRAVKSNSEALTRITKEEADFNAFLISFENTVANAKRLSDVVDRTSVPAWNRRQLEYQANIKGDPNAKNLLSQMEVLAREGNRVMDRAKGAGAEHSKEEARKLYDPAMTKTQFESLLENVLSKDAMYGVMGFEQEKAALRRAIQNPYEDIPAKDRPKEEAPGATPAATAPAVALPPHAHREGNDIVSDSGKYIWRDGKWQTR